MLAPPPNLKGRLSELKYLHHKVLFKVAFYLEQMQVQQSNNSVALLNDNSDYQLK